MKRYPIYKSNYEKYINFTKNKNNQYEKNKSSLSSENDEYNKIYQDIIYNNTLDEYFNLVYNYIDIQDIFDNLTLPFVKLPNHHNNEHNIMINLKGDKNGIPDLSRHEQYGSEHGESKLKPIESIDIKRKFKCFTFFDETQILFSKNQVNLEKIKIDIYFPQSWFPYDNNTGISIAIHSPNIIPNRDSFYKLEQSAGYIIYYSKMENIRLSNYDNCIDRGDIKNDTYTRKFCLDKCFHENYST